VLADPASTEDRRTADLFLEEAQQMAAVKISFARGKSAKKPILLGRYDREPIKGQLKKLGLAIDDTFHPEGYVLDVAPQQIVLAATTHAGLFYGMQTLRQLLRPDGRIPALRIRDWPAMRYRGISDDISRGPVPTLEYMKKQIRTLAEYKMNMLSLYMEHTFDYTGHPLIGPKGAALTAAEVRELVAYAKNYYIDLVPEQQAFGHMHHVLKHERYSDLAETPHGHVLAPVNEDVYKFIGELYAELVPLFPSPFLHIGCDETFELGQGKSKERAKEIGLGNVYLNHMQRVRDLLKPYGKRLMFWGDIALHYKDLLEKFPKDLVVMNWRYSAPDSFDSYLKPFKDAGLDQFVCPGVSNWNHIFPNIKNAIKNIRNFVRDGQRYGAIGMMNTTWDDDGEALFEHTWYGIVFGAACAWQEGETSIEDFEAKFDWAFYRNEGNEFTKAINNLGKIHDVLNLQQNTDSFFWEDPFTRVNMEKIRVALARAREVRLLAEEVIEIIERRGSAAKSRRENLAALKFAAQRFDHLGRKIQEVADLSKKYWEAYRNVGNKVAVRQTLLPYTGFIHNTVQELRDEIVFLKNSYRDVWLQENRPYWLDNNLVRYEYMALFWEGKIHLIKKILADYDATGQLPKPEDLGLFLQ
jgi:hypothetical protein